MRWKESQKVYMDVYKMDYWQGEDAHQGRWVARDFAALVGLRSPCPGSAILCVTLVWKTKN
jgi:hypothetical protein